MKKETVYFGQRILVTPAGAIFSTLYPSAGWDELDVADALLAPGRQIHRLVFGFPFTEVNFKVLNDFTIKQVRRDPESAALLLVNPGMSADYVERSLGCGRRWQCKLDEQVDAGRVPAGGSGWWRDPAH